MAAPGGGGSGTSRRLICSQSVGNAGAGPGRYDHSLRDACEYPTPAGRSHLLMTNSQPRRRSLAKPVHRSHPRPRGKGRRPQRLSTTDDPLPFQVVGSRMLTGRVDQFDRPAVDRGVGGHHIASRPGDGRDHAPFETRDRALTRLLLPTLGTPATATRPRPGQMSAKAGPPGKFLRDLSDAAPVGCRQRRGDVIQRGLKGSRHLLEENRGSPHRWRVDNSMVRGVYERVATKPVVR